MYILGVNYSIDSAAALLRDGAITAAVTDERFTRKKHSRDFPVDSINYCLQNSQISLAELDAIAFFWNPGIHLESFNPRRSSRYRHHSEYLWILPNYLLAQYPADWHRLKVEHIEQSFVLAGVKKPLKIYYVTHHLAHAASAFFVSPFEESAILTVDGYGEKSAALLARGAGNKVHRIQEIDFPHSLGAFYAAITQYLGYTANFDEGIIMGLAAWGEPRFYDDLKEIVRFAEPGKLEIDLSYFSFHLERPRRYSEKFLEKFGRDRKPGEPLEQRHKDLAASAQKILEEALINLARHLKKSTGQKRLCLAGGVALNCVANSKILEAADFQDAFIQPAAGDNGTSLGSALYVYHQLLNQPRGFVMNVDYCGPEYSDEEIEKELRNDGIAFETPADISKAGAALLHQGKIIGWFQGRMEFGPRALGNRSILADPRTEKSRERLNEQIKKRESFRPYAPSVLREACGQYFEGRGDSPFMLKNFLVRPEKRALIPAVVHVDGSARVQTVDRNRNPAFWLLIKEFEKLSGIPVVLNTSFNGKGEAMVGTVKDALQCFFSTGLDALAIGSYLIRK